MTRLGKLQLATWYEWRRIAKVCVHIAMARLAATPRRVPLRGGCARARNQRPLGPSCLQLADLLDPMLDPSVNINNTVCVLDALRG